MSGLRVPGHGLGNIRFRDPQQAFADAIALGELSRDPKHFDFAGDWMYMHTTDSGLFDSFKHIDSRQYRLVPNFACSQAYLDRLVEGLRGEA